MVPMIFCLACVQPTLPDFWSSLMPNVESLSIPMRLVGANFQAYLFLIMCDVGVVAIYSGFPFNFGSLCILKVMRYGFFTFGAVSLYYNKMFQFYNARIRITERQEAFRMRKTRKDMMTLYQTLHVLVLEYNKVYTIIIASTKICIFSFAIFGVYGSLRTDGVMALFLLTLGVFSVGFLAVYLLLTGELHSSSTAFLAEARQQLQMGMGRKYDMDTRWLRKYLRSLPVLKVQVGSAYFIDKPIVLTTFRIEFESIINFLIMSA